MNLTPTANIGHLDRQQVKHIHDVEKPRSKQNHVSYNLFSTNLTISTTLSAPKSGPIYQVYKQELSIDSMLNYTSVLDNPI